MTKPANRQAERGFALLEALAAIVLMGLILSSLAVMTAPWMPAWKKVYDRVQRSETFALALDRVADDISAALFVPADDEARTVLFEGDDRAIKLVRRAIGPNLERGLELVRIGDALDVGGSVVVRSRTAFVPGTRDVDPAAAPVVLIRPPFRLGFEFAGADGVWLSDWQGQEALPMAVLVAVLDAGGRRRLARVVPLHVQQPPPENCGNSACGPDHLAANADQPDDGSPSPDRAATRP